MSDVTQDATFKLGLIAGMGRTASQHDGTVADISGYTYMRELALDLQVPYLLVEFANQINKSKTGEAPCAGDLRELLAWMNEHQVTIEQIEAVFEDHVTEDEHGTQITPAEAGERRNDG